MTLLSSLVHAEPPRVEFIVEAERKPLSERLVAALETQLGELGVEVALRGGNDSDAASATDVGDVRASEATSEGGEPIALVWIRDQRGALVIQFFEPRGERLRVREVPLRDDDPVSIEEVSLIVRSYVEALLAAPPPEPEEPAVLPPAPVEEEAPQPPPAGGAWHPQLRLEAAFSATAFATDAGWQLGAHLGLGASGLGPVVLGVHTSVLEPIRIEQGELSLQVRRYPVGLFAGLRLPVVSTLWLSPRLTAQADVLQRRAEGRGDTVATADETRTSFAVGAELLVEWRLLPWGGVVASGGAEAALGRYDFSVTTPQGEETILSPLPVRPSLGLGIWLQLP